MPTYSIAGALPPLPSPGPEDLTLWLVDFAAVGALVLVGAKLVDLFRRKPPIEHDLERLLDKVRQELNQMRLDNTQQVADVRAQIDGAHARVDALTRDINGKLQRLPAEIVDLLYKTGAIQKPK